MGHDWNLIPMNGEDLDFLVLIKRNSYKPYHQVVLCTAIHAFERLKKPDINKSNKWDKFGTRSLNLSLSKAGHITKSCLDQMIKKNLY